MDAFSVARVSRALATQVIGVDVVKRLDASAAEVARLRVRFADRDDLSLIGKSTTDDGAWRELRFYQQLAPRWDHPAPQLLGSWDDGDRILLLTEDLTAAGYRSPGAEVSDDQLRGTIASLVALHATFWNQLDVVQPALSITSTAQAWPPDVISTHAEAVRLEKSSTGRR